MATETVEATEDLVTLKAPDGLDNVSFEGQTYTAAKDGTFRLPGPFARILRDRHGWASPEPTPRTEAAYAALKKQKAELETRHDGLRQQLGTIAGKETALLARLEGLRADIKAGKVEAVAAIAPAEAELVSVRSTLRAVRDAEAAVSAEVDVAASTVADEERLREGVRQRKASADLRAEAEKCLTEFRETVLRPRRCLHKLKVIAEQMGRQFPLAPVVPLADFDALVGEVETEMRNAHELPHEQGRQNVAVWLRTILNGPGMLRPTSVLMADHHLKQS